MTAYSHHNRLLFGYGESSLNRRHIGAELWYRYERCERLPVSFADECRRTARLVHQQALELGRPIYILLSGGLDSAVMVKTFKEAGVPFKTATYVFENDLNIHEMQYVTELERNEQLDHHHMVMDAQRWFHGEEARTWFFETDAWELGTLPLMKLMQHVWCELGGFPVFGGGDIDIVKHDGTWHYGRYESFLSRYWAASIIGIPQFVSFFQHTPEITLSMLNEPLIRRAATGQDALANRILPDLKAVKFNVYHQNWPDLRRRIKFGGTELIHRWLGPLELKWRQERSLSYGELWTTPYDQLVSALTPLPAAPADEPGPR